MREKDSWIAVAKIAKEKGLKNCCSEDVLSRTLVCLKWLNYNHHINIVQLLRSLLPLIDILLSHHINPNKGAQSCHNCCLMFLPGNTFATLENQNTHTCLPEIVLLQCNIYLCSYMDYLTRSPLSRNGKCWCFFLQFLIKYWKEISKDYTVFILQNKVALEIHKVAYQNYHTVSDGYTQLLV